MGTPDLKINAMRYHGPGWVVTVEGDEDVQYMLWAPNEKREHWAANWTRTGNRADGVHRQGATKEEALTAFPGDEVGQRAREMLAAASDSPGPTGRVLVMGQYYWGVGSTLAGAKHKFKQEGGFLSKGYIVYEFDDETEFLGVDGMGRFNYRGNEPAETRFPPKAAR